MTEFNSISTGLWGLFHAEIGTGDPVFFCFSQEALKSQLSESVLGGRSPLDVVCDAARACYDVYDHDVFLRPGVLRASETGFSMAIVLICQQVLAVEEMVRDGNRYSENAYFPRLRSMMSPLLAQLSQNPFSFYEFESIWRTFAHEIRSIPGSTGDTVTFEFDAYSGVNKARSFPLSQALLSRADLAELLRQCRLERLRTGSPRDAWIEIYRERNHLSRRGQRLVSGGFLRDRLVEQIQTYARRASAILGVRESLQRTQLDLAVCLDVTDWDSEEYIAFLTVKGGVRRVDDEQQLRSVIDAVLRERGYAFLALGEFGDYWSFSEAARRVERGDTVLLLGTTIGIERGKAILDGLSPSVSIEDGRLRALGAGASNIRVCPVTLPTNLDGSVIVRAGRITPEVTYAPGAGSYEWLGGVCLDRRARKYLRQGLPMGIRFGHREFRIDELNRVGDSPITWDGLVKAIQKLEVDASYELRFGTGCVARLSIAVERVSVEHTMGFLVDNNGMLSPTLEQIGEKGFGVVGFSQRGIEPVYGANARTVGLLLQDLIAGAGRRLTPREADVVLKRIDPSSVPRNVKRMIRELLSRGGKVRDETLAILRVY